MTRLFRTSFLLLLFFSSEIGLAQDQGSPATDDNFGATDPDLEREGNVAANTANSRDQNDATLNQEINRATNNNRVRQFHEVLENLLTEFSYEVKTGQLGNIKNLSIRHVEVNDALPRSYGGYVEYLIAERIREFSRIKLISCLPCRSKSSKIVDDQLIITSPITSTEEMTRAAEQLGVDYFMDAMLVYHTTHMVLAFQIFNTQTKELVWARTFNSETVRSRYQALAADFSQIQKKRSSDEYIPEYRYLVGIGGVLFPNIRAGVDESNMISVHMRGTEKFNNRRSEFGLLFSINISRSSLINAYPSSGASNPDDETVVVVEEEGPTPFTTALGLYGLFTHNFLGEIELYDKIRYGVNAALGLHLASGYLAPALRFGWDIHLGRSFAVNLGVLYVTSANIVVDNQIVKTDGGLGGDLVISYNL